MPSSLFLSCISVACHQNLGNFQSLFFQILFPKFPLSTLFLGLWCHKCETFWYLPAGKRELFNSYTHQIFSPLFRLDTSHWFVFKCKNFYYLWFDSSVLLEGFLFSYLFIYLIFSSQISIWFLFIFISLLRLSIFSFI